MWRLAGKRAAVEESYHSRARCCAGKAAGQSANAAAATPRKSRRLIETPPEQGESIASGSGLAGTVLLQFSFVHVMF
jgi:hypothetical protein